MPFTYTRNLEIVLCDLRMFIFDSRDKCKNRPHRSNVGGPKGMDESVNNMLGGNVCIHVNYGLFKIQEGI